MQRGARHIALEQGDQMYFTGLPCVNGHIAERYAKTGVCKACARESARKAYKEDPSRFSKASKKWRRRNPDYAENNRDRINSNSRKYQRQNRAKATALRASYRARKKQAQPDWLSAGDMQKISDLYRLASYKSAETGEPWEVDHIVPLAGDSVCGLHVPWNLQIIPQASNRRKSNSFEGQMEGKKANGR